MEEAHISYLCLEFLGVAPIEPIPIVVHFPFGSLKPNYDDQTT
jgi:hypothetical protein